MPASPREVGCPAYSPARPAAVVLVLRAGAVLRGAADRDAAQVLGARAAVLGGEALDLHREARQRVEALGARRLAAAGQLAAAEPPQAAREPRVAAAELAVLADAGETERLVHHRHRGVDHVLRLAHGVVARLLLRGEPLRGAGAAVEKLRVDILAHGLGDVGEALGLLEREVLLEGGRRGDDLAVGLGDGLLDVARQLVGLGEG